MVSFAGENTFRTGRQWFYPGNEWFSVLFPMCCSVFKCSRLDKRKSDAEELCHWAGGRPESVFFLGFEKHWSLLLRRYDDCWHRLMFSNLLPLCEALSSLLPTTAE